MGNHTATRSLQRPANRPGRSTAFDSLVSRQGIVNVPAVDALKAQLDQEYAAAARTTTHEERQALHYYANVNFMRVNNALRSGTRVSPQFQRRIIDHLDSLIAKMRAPHQVTAYFARQTQITSDQARAMVGKTISFGPAYRSLSVSPLYPLTNFAKDTIVRGQRAVLYEVSVPKGARAAWFGALGSAWKPWVSGGSLTQNRGGDPREVGQSTTLERRNDSTLHGHWGALGWEGELLLPGGSAFHVDRVYERQVSADAYAYQHGALEPDTPYPPAPVMVVSGHLVAQ